jgi:hypothetical protein
MKYEGWFSQMKSSVFHKCNSGAEDSSQIQLPICVNRWKAGLYKCVLETKLVSVVDRTLN